MTQKRTYVEREASVTLDPELPFAAECTNFRYAGRSPISLRLHQGPLWDDRPCVLLLYEVSSEDQRMDIFGKALRDREAGVRHRMLTIRRDDDHIDAHDPDLYFTEMPFQHEAGLLAQAEGPVLDVGCGAGRTLLWLEQKGIKATGIDLSSGAVKVSRLRGCRDVHHGDVMAEGSGLFEEQKFQTVVLFGNNVGIGGTIEGAATLLRRLAFLTSPDGHLLVTGLDIAQTDERHHIAYHDANLAKGRPRGEISMRFEYQGKVSDWVQWFHPEPAELELLANESGWNVVHVGPASGPFFAGTLRKSR